MHSGAKKSRILSRGRRPNLNSKLGVINNSGAREGELYSQLQAEQAKLNEVVDRLNALDKSLDTATTALKSKAEGRHGRCKVRFELADLPYHSLTFQTTADAPSRRFAPKFGC